MPLIGELFSGPIDIVGDVHGETEAMERLLKKFGYDDVGRRTDDRRLVIVGELPNCGPDSAALLNCVIALVHVYAASHPDPRGRG